MAFWIFSRVVCVVGPVYVSVCVAVCVAVRVSVCVLLLLVLFTVALYTHLRPLGVIILDELIFYLSFT